MSKLFLGGGIPQELKSTCWIIGRVVYFENVAVKEKEIDNLLQLSIRGKATMKEINPHPPLESLYLSGYTPPCRIFRTTFSNFDFLKTSLIVQPHQPPEIAVSRMATKQDVERVI